MSNLFIILNVKAVGKEGFASIWKNCWSEIYAGQLVIWRTIIKIQKMRYNTSKK